MRIWLDVQASGATTGPGPVVAVVAFTSRTRLNRAGDWRATVPATDERAVELLQPRRTVLAYAMLNGVQTLIGGGVIESLRVQMSSGAPMLEVSGTDLLEELGRGTVGDVTIYNPSMVVDLDTFISDNTPSGWTIPGISGTQPEFVAHFVYETFLGALAALADKLPIWFRLSPTSTLARRAEVLVALPSTASVRCVANADPLSVEGNAGVCLITNITEERQAADIVSQLIPFGAGNGQARLSLAAATQWPDGTALSTNYIPLPTVTLNYNRTGPTINITNGNAAADYGLIQRALAWKDIAPISNSDADVTAAANTLLAAACEYMIRHGAPAYVYSLTVAGLNTTVLPGDLVRVQARRMRDGETPISIDRDCRVLEVQTTVDPNGLRTTGLAVSTVDYWPASDVEAVVSEIRQSQIMEALPQMGPSVDTISYREPIDDDYSADLRFWLGDETTSVNQVIIRFRVDPFRSTAKTVGGTVDATVDIPAHTHTVSIDDHTHDIPDHQHRVGLSQGSGGRNVGIFTGGGFYYEGTDVGTLSVYTTNDSGSTTSDDGGSSSPTSSSGGGQTGLEVDISSALTLSYGIYEDSAGSTYAATDLEWLVNGTAASGTAAATTGGWYELDITADVADADTYRPNQAANAVTVRVKTASKTGKRAQVTAQIERRTVIQAIAYT